MDMRIVRVALTAWVALVPSALYAQVALAGTVKDASSAVLPGVTVEASSPALIEKTRTATTHATGQYRLERLRPGTYSETFQLAGVATVTRDDVILADTNR